MKNLVKRERKNEALTPLSIILPHDLDKLSQFSPNFANFGTINMNHLILSDTCETFETSRLQTLVANVYESHKKLPLYSSENLIN